MVQSVEHLGAKLEFHTLGYVKGFNEAQIEIPVTGSLENVSPGAICTRCWQCKSGAVLEDHGPEDAGHILQLRLHRRNDVRPRDMRVVRGQHTAANAEGLA